MGNAASVSRHKNALKKIVGALRSARKASDRKFGKIYLNLAAARASSDRKLASATSQLTASIAKRSALYDARFQKTVKNMALARKQAFLQVQQARKGFTTQLSGIVSSVKDQETRLQGEIAVVSSEVASNKASQIRINRKLDAEKRRIQKIMDSRHSSSLKWRGRFRSLIRKLRARVARNRRQAAQDLTKATRRLYSTMSAAQARQARRFKGLKGALAKAKMSAARALSRSKGDFKAKLTTLTNTVVANNRKFEVGLQRITKVAHSFKQSSAADRRNMRSQIKGMQQDLNKAVIRSIQIGEAKGKRLEERARANMSAVRKAMQGEIAQRLEVMSDNVYAAIKGNRGKIADNYLALKAYCGANAGAIIDYTTKNSGRGLSAVGDFLTTVASLSQVRTKPWEGPGAGGKKMLPLFGGKSGQMVFVNGHAIGLSNKLADFDKLACRAKEYQTFLHHLTAKLPKKIKKKGKKAFNVKPPEWSGK